MKKSIKYSYLSKKMKRSIDITSEQLQEYKFKKVNKNTPETYEDCPDNIKMELFKRHSHAEIQRDKDPSTVVYTEEDVIELIYLAKQGKI